MIFKLFAAVKVKFDYINSHKNITINKQTKKWRIFDNHLTRTVNCVFDESP